MKLKIEVFFCISLLLLLITHSSAAQNHSLRGYYDWEILTLSYVSTVNQTELYLISLINTNFVTHHQLKSVEKNEFIVHNNSICDTNFHYKAHYDREGKLVRLTKPFEEEVYHYTEKGHLIDVDIQLPYGFVDRVGGISIEEVHHKTREERLYTPKENVRQINSYFDQAKTPSIITRITYKKKNLLHKITEINLFKGSKKQYVFTYTFFD